MTSNYVHGYDRRANVRLQDQADALVELLHSDTRYPEGSLVLEAGTYRPLDLDNDALNAQFRAAMSGHPWDVIQTQAQAARYRIGRVWYALPSRTDAAAWWVAKAGAEHYREHLGRLRAWVSELHGA